jgi:hypothetical protein
MESGKKHCHSVSASSGFSFKDRAEGHNQEGAKRDTWRTFINLEDREQGIDISAAIDEHRRWQAAEDAKRKGEAPPQYDPPPRQCLWDGGNPHRPAEKLYRFSRARHGEDRWVLAYPERDDLLARELHTSEEAAYWIRRINPFALPSDLGNITTATTDDAYPRLRPDWRPKADLSTRSKDAQDVLDSHGKADPSKRTETDVSDALGKDENTDPLTETLDLIPRSTHLPLVIEFLAKRKHRSAKLLDISRHVYKAVDKASLAKTRKLITRNIPLLEGRDTPLRLHWNDETKIAKLLNRDGT